MEGDVGAVLSEMKGAADAMDAMIERNARKWPAS
jgi:hypothetical protein